MFLLSLSVHMTSIFILCLVHVLHKRENITEVSFFDIIKNVDTQKCITMTLSDNE